VLPPSSASSSGSGAGPANVEVGTGSRGGSFGRSRRRLPVPHGQLFRPRHGQRQGSGRLSIAELASLVREVVGYGVRSLRLLQADGTPAKLLGVGRIRGASAGRRSPGEGVEPIAGSVNAPGWSEDSGKSASRDGLADHRRREGSLRSRPVVGSFSDRTSAK